MKERNVDLVIFDCDGVLVDSEMISARIFAETIQRAGIQMSTEQVFKEFKGGSMGASMARVIEILGGPPSFDVEAAYRAECDRIFRLEMKPIHGIEPILKSLNIPIAVASNGPQNKIRLNLEITGLDRYFPSESIFSAYDFNKWKPDPTMFLEAASSFNIAPENSIVIGDSIADVGAAVAAGMTCYAYAPLGDQEGLADAGGIVINSMTDLNNYLNIY